MSEKKEHSGKRSARLEPYKEREPFVFVSYPHSEIVKVEAVLRFLQRAGIRFWYDQEGAAIDPGFGWEDWISDRFENSAMFLCFLVNGVEQRREVLREIGMAIKRREEDPDYHVVFIFLEKMPVRVFERAGAPEIGDFIRKNQFIEYKGITDDFLGQLFSKNVFQDRLVAEEYLKDWRNREKKDLTHEISEVLVDNPYVYETAFPEEAGDSSFYRVRTEEVDPDAVCLICLDNQWCPSDFYADPEFWKEGFTSHRIVQAQGDYQQAEVFRALLHHRQLIVNRAFFFNSLVFERWYDRNGPDYEAFRKLLGDGSLLVFLTLEDKPYDENKRPAFGTANYDIWGQICRETKVFCLRMDWMYPKANRQKLEQRLFRRFQSFCLTAAEDEQQLNNMAEAFFLEGPQKRDFIKTWHDVQMHAAARDREEKASYTREMFYRHFLVRKGTDVNDCVLDIRKAFVPELKEVVDLRYGLNLAEALGVRPLLPAHGHLRDYYRTGPAFENSSRELTPAELTCAVGNFVPDFLLDRVDYPMEADMSLDEIVLLREMQEWKDYIRTVSNGRKRAHIQEVDFYDIAYVWERFYLWMEKAREETEDTEQIRWMTVPGAVSLIYRLGSYEIITVYHAGDPVMDVRSTLKNASEIPEGRDLPVLVTIDYVCADILAEPEAGQASAFRGARDNFMLAELRLFEGMSEGVLSEMFSSLMEKITAMPHRFQDPDPEKLRREKDFREKRGSEEWRAYVEKLQEADAGLYEERRYLRDKRNRTEWLWYVDLMRERPQAFLQDRMLEVITDLETICRYEREMKKKNVDVRIGVRYRSPYSMMVVDLVRGPDGRLFTYERIFPAVPRGAVVCVPFFEGRFVLLEQFRHALRGYQLAFPRGFAEKGLSGAENAAKELGEELGSRVESISFLGHIVADSGAGGNLVEVYACRISEPQLREGYEGIRKPVVFTEEELKAMVARGEINDGYTLAALELLKAGR